MEVITVIMYLVLVMIVSFVELTDSIRLLIIILATVILFIMCLIALRIEQVAGYYKCAKCNQRSWNKKVLSKSPKILLENYKK